MRTLFVVFLLVCAGAALIFSILSREPDPIQTSLSVSAALSVDTAGYARAHGPRPFVFPSDHGPHPEFRTEWWYYTGNVQTDTGRRFGYQFTIFRTALSPSESDHRESIDAVRGRAPSRSFSDGAATENGVTDGEARDSAAPDDGTSDRAALDSSTSNSWSTNQLYMAHLALTDVRSKEHYAQERFSRGAAGLAGATAEPYHVWIEDWEITGLDGNADSVRIRAQTEGFGLDVVAARTKPIVLQGEDGYDRKGQQPGNASYYYSMSRMATRGVILLDGSRVAVTGTTWLDREWGTSALSADQVGWDWFSLQLQNDIEVMYYQIRERDGSASQYSGGVVVDREGSTLGITPDDIRLDVLDMWESETGAATYPSEWRLEIPSLQIDLHMKPQVADQELRLSIRYWEGTVHVQGTHAGVPVEGYGFVELTGYDENERDHARR